MPLSPLQSGTAPSPRLACTPPPRLIARSSTRGSSNACRSPGTSAGSGVQSKVATACSPLPAQPACSLAASVPTPALGTPPASQQGQLQHQTHEGSTATGTAYGPGWLTSRICAARDVGELEAIIDSAADLNSIHVAAAIVRLAKVADGQGGASTDADPSSPASRQQPGASSSSDNGHVMQRLHARRRRSGRQAAALSSDPRSTSSNKGSSVAAGADGANPAAAALAERLGSMYLEHSAQGAYTTARQHSNITWAFSKLSFAPPAGTLQRAVTQLLEGGQRRLRTSTPQEVANLAYALAQLRVVWPGVWGAIAAEAKGHMAAFKPQELSCLAWALATMQTWHQQHHQQQQQQQQQQHQQQQHSVQVQQQQQQQQQVPQQQQQLGAQAERPSPQHHGAAATLQPVEHREHRRSEGVFVDLLQAVALQAAQDVHRFKPSELSTILWATVKAGVQSQPLLDAASHHLVSILSGSSSSSSSSLHRIPNGGSDSIAYHQLQQQPDAALQEGLGSHFDSQGVANMLWALSKAGYHSPQLLQAVGDELASSHQLPQSVAVGGRPSPAASEPTGANRTAGPGQAQTKRRLCPDLCEFNGQELCNVLGAFARLRRRHDGLMAAASQLLTTWAEADTLPPQSIANAVWAMARMSQLPQQAGAAVGLDASSPQHLQLQVEREQIRAELEHFTHTMAAAAARSVQQFKAQELSNVLWGLLKLQEHLGSGPSPAHEEVILSARAPGATAQTSEAHDQGLPVGSQQQSGEEQNRIQQQHVTEQQLGSNVQAAGLEQQRQQQRRRQQQQKRQRHALPTSSAGNPADDAFAASLLHLANAARWRAGSMEPAALAQLAWACWRLAGPDADHLVLAVSSAALPRLAEFKAQELTTLVHSLARQKQVYVDVRLLRAAGDAAVALLQARGGARSFTPSGLANLAWAFAVRGQRHDGLARAIAVSARSRIGHFSDQELANLLWGLFWLGRCDKALLDAAAECIITQSEGAQANSSGSREAAQEAAVDAGAGAAAAANLRPSRAAGMAAAVQAWCFARCRYNMPRLYDALGAAVLPHLACVPTLNLAQMLWAFASQGCRHRPLLAAAARLVTTRLLQADAARGSSRRHSTRSSDAGTTGATGTTSPGSLAASSLDASGAAALAPGDSREGPIAGRMRRRALAPAEALDASVPMLGPAPAPPCDDPPEQLQAAGAGASGYHAPSHSAEDGSSPSFSETLPAGLLLAADLDPRLNPEVNTEPVHPGDLCLFAWAFAKLRFPHPALLSTLLRTALRDAAHYNLKGWSQLVWAFSTLGLPEEELLMSRLQQLQLQQQAQQAQQQGEAQAGAQQRQHQQRQQHQHQGRHQGQAQGSGGLARDKVTGRRKGSGGSSSSYGGSSSNSMPRPRRQWATGAGRGGGGNGGGSSSSGGGDEFRPARRPTHPGRNVGGSNSNAGSNRHRDGEGAWSQSMDATAVLEAVGSVATAAVEPSCSCLLQPGPSSMHSMLGQTSLGTAIGMAAGQVLGTGDGNGASPVVAAGRLQQLLVAPPPLPPTPAPKAWLQEGPSSSDLASSSSSSSGSSSVHGDRRRASRMGADTGVAMVEGLEDADGDGYAGIEEQQARLLWQASLYSSSSSSRRTEGSRRGDPDGQTPLALSQQAMAGAAEHRLAAAHAGAELLPRPNRPLPAHSGAVELDTAAAMQHSGAAAAAAAAGHAWEDGQLRVAPASVVVMAAAPQAL